MVGASTETFEFFPDIPENAVGELGPEIAEWKEAFLAEDGLIPQVAMPGLFGISKQAASKLPGSYALTEYNFFGKKWYSKRETEALYKLKRQTGGKGHKLSRVVRDMLEDARQDVKN